MGGFRRVLVADIARVYGGLRNRSQESFTGVYLRIEIWECCQKILPPPDVAADMDRCKPWVQAFEVPGGEVIFNHLTAGLQLELSHSVDII